MLKSALSIFLFSLISTYAFADRSLGYFADPASLQFERTKSTENEFTANLEIKIYERIERVVMEYGQDPICGSEEICSGSGSSGGGGSGSNGGGGSGGWSDGGGSWDDSDDWDDGGWDDGSGFSLDENDDSTDTKYMVLALYSCYWRTKSCMHPETRIINNYHHSEKVTVKAIFDKNNLRVGETELVVLSWNSNLAKISINNARFEYLSQNQLDCSYNQSVTFNVRAGNRIISAPPNSTEITFKNDNGLVAVIKDLGASDNDDGSTVYHLVVKENGLFDKTLFDKEVNELPEKGFEINSAIVNFQEEKSYIVTTKLKRNIPAIYNEEWSGDLTMKFDYDGTTVTITSQENEDEEKGGCLVHSGKDDKLIIIVGILFLFSFLITISSRKDNI